MFTDTWKTAPGVRGWLVICFLGESTANRGELPRVGRWARSELPELVSLSPGSRRLLAQLAIPPLRFGVGLSETGVADMLAGELAKPLPRRSANQVRRELELPRTTEYRHRLQLQRELEAQGLEDHLQTGRGWLQLHRAYTDVAMLTQLVRDGDWERAKRLLAAVGQGDLHHVQWILPDPWPERCRPAVLETLSLAKERLGASRRGAPRPGPAAGTPTEALVPVGRALPWRNRPVDPAPARRRRLRRALAPLAASAAAVAAVASLPWSGEPDDVLALTWPRPDTPYQEPRHAGIANLSKELGLDDSVPATRGDELLVRARIRAARARRRGRAVEGYIAAGDGQQTRANLELVGAGSGLGAEVEARTGSPDLRLRWVPGTTVLRAADGTLLERLPDVRNGRRIPLPELQPGQRYYVDTRLAVGRVTADDPGQVAQTELICFDPREDPGRASGHVQPGRTMGCKVELLNLGPRTLDTVYLRFLSGRDERERMATTWVVTDSALASPRRTYLADAKRVLGGRRWPAVRFVAGSLRAVTAEGEEHGLGGGFFKGAEIGELAPGPDNALTLEFRVVVD